MQKTSRILVAAAALSSTGAGSALADTVALYSGLPSVAVNQQLNTYETLAREAVGTRFTPLSDRIGADQNRDSRFWVDTEGRFIDMQSGDGQGVYGAFMGGFDVLVSPGATLGMMAGYIETDTEGTVGATDGRMQSRSFGVGAYGGLALGENLSMNAFVAYTKVGYDFWEDGTGHSAKPDADRLSGGVGIEASYPLGSAVFSPYAGVSMTQEWQDSYTDTGGVFGSGEDYALFRGVVGAKLGTSMTLGGSEMSPWLLLAADLTADDAGSASKVDDGASGRVGAGIDIPMNGLLVRIAGDVSGLGSADYTDAGGSITLNYPID